MRHKLEIDSVISFENDLLTRNKRSGFYKLDPRFKLFLLTASIILNIVVAIPTLSITLLGIGTFFILITRPHLKTFILFLLAPFFSTAVVVAGFGAGFGHTELFKIASIPFFLEGFDRGIEVAVRVYCDVIWLSLVFLTTSFPNILKALKWYRMPVVILDIMSFMYRYSFLLFAEFKRMRAASFCKGGLTGKRTTFKTYSKITAQIFLRCFDRSERIYWAMFARGGENHD